MITRNQAAQNLENAFNDAKHLLILDENYVSGADGAEALVLVGKCLLEAENGRRFDASADLVTSLTHKDDNQPPAELGNIQNAIRAAREAEVDFVLCFHVAGDHRWHLEWGNGYDCQSAMAAVWQFVQNGMIL